MFAELLSKLKFRDKEDPQQTADALSNLDARITLVASRSRLTRTDYRLKTFARQLVLLQFINLTYAVCHLALHFYVNLQHRIGDNFHPQWCSSVGNIHSSGTVISAIVLACIALLLGWTS